MCIILPLRENSYQYLTWLHLLYISPPPPFNLGTHTGQLLDRFNDRLICIFFNHGYTGGPLYPAQMSSLMYLILAKK